jgi:1-acyl-sn-glycerol-3-phosphate acyltransferase
MSVAKPGGVVGDLVRLARRIIRPTLGLAGTLVLFAVWLSGRPFQRGARANAWRAWIFQRWARWTLLVMHIHCNVRGEPPRGPCFLVTNHVGYADVFVLAAACRGAVFVSMKELGKWPLLGAMSRAMGTIYIDRANKREIPQVHTDMSRALAAGAVVVFFPEGSNSRGERVREFRSALFEIAARERIPVAWAAIHYKTGPSDPPASRAVGWVFEPLSQQAPRFLAVSRIDATITFGAERVVAGDRKELARATRALVESRFVPLE